MEKFGNPHPYGAKALGNYLLENNSSHDVRNLGLGRLALLSDENILELLSYLNGKDLAIMNKISRAMYVFSSHDDLWRNLVLSLSPESLRFINNWKDSFVYLYCHKFSITNRIREHVPIKVSGIYSDAIHRAWYCCTFDFQGNCRSFYDHCDVPRIRTERLSIWRFVNDFEVPNKPVIICNIVNKWPAYKQWNEEYLTMHTSGKTFRATSTTAPMAASFTIQDYFKYMSQCREEAPFYLFDREISQVAQLRKDYSNPKYFSQNNGMETIDGVAGPTTICTGRSIDILSDDRHEGGEKHHATDLFRLFGEHRRPDYHWLILGPARSGSIFHIDPNQTNAWNACIRGRKKWIFYPPTNTPPGIMSTIDNGDLIVPLSTGEWLLSFWSFHLEQRNHPDPGKRPLECIVEPGELIFVPHNWWHMVINLDDSIALTYNYVSSSNLVDCLLFLSEKRDQISGVRDRADEGVVQPEGIYEEFVELLCHSYPTLLERALLDIELLKRTRRERGEKVSVLKSIFPNYSRGRCPAYGRKRKLGRARGGGGAPGEADKRGSAGARGGYNRCASYTGEEGCGERSGGDGAEKDDGLDQNTRIRRRIGKMTGNGTVEVSPSDGDWGLRNDGEEVSRFAEGDPVLRNIKLYTSGAFCFNFNVTE